MTIEILPFKEQWIWSFANPERTTLFSDLQNIIIVMSICRVRLYVGSEVENCRYEELSEKRREVEQADLGSKAGRI